MRFIDGLRDDIKSIIIVQRPVNLDTACYLALLQEAAESSRRPEPVLADRSYMARPMLKLATSSAACWDQSRTGVVENPKHTFAASPTTDSKVSSLHACRCARGLC
jgi:hypothetical protein